MATRPYIPNADWSAKISINKKFLYRLKADDEPVKALWIYLEIVEFQKEICRRYDEQICALKFYKL